MDKELKIGIAVGMILGFVQVFAFSGDPSPKSVPTVKKPEPARYLIFDKRGDVSGYVQEVKPCAN